MNYETSLTASTRDGTAMPGHHVAGDTTDGRGNGKRRLAILALVIAALIGAVAAAYFLVTGGEPAATEAGDDTEAAAVSVIAPGRTTIEGEIEATGTLAARRELPVGVAGEGGRVVSVPVDAGEWVRAGQTLAVIDRSVQNQQVESASASIEVARADARLAQSNLDRALQLVDRGFISKADVDRLTATRDAASARVKVARAQVGELRARSARLNITAPAAGYVLERNVEPGQVVGGGSGPLFLIAQGGEMELMARLSESDLSRISTGVSAQVIPVGTDKIFNGQVWQISPTIDAQNRQGTARIALPYAQELRPGGFASATIRSGTIVAPVLPESAVLSDDEGRYVYIVNRDNKAVRRSVQTGLVNENGIAITGGLRGNERIVLRAGGFLTAGETVAPKLVKR
ncbi:MAG: efflux RND transporter periplasmic adaptor subunit [Pontixanthobacter sp.]